MTSGEEIPLTGGRITPGVVRIGDTVRRPLKAAAVELSVLLDHLAAQGFDGAPRFLGHDPRGRAILTFIEGDVPTDLAHFDDAQLVAAARLLRRFHDATTELGAVLAAGAEVLCHNDFGPPNAVFRDGHPYAMIDYDTVAPGSRLWDLGYSAFSWLDLGNDDYTGPEQVRRISAFANAYAHPQCSDAALAIHAVARQFHLATWGETIGQVAMCDWAHAAATWTMKNVVVPLNRTGFPSTLPNQSA